MTPNFFATPGANGAKTATPLDQFNNFVNVICPSLDISIPNGVIVASCFHTGYFLLRTLRPLADAALNVSAGDENNSMADDFDKYIDDFCNIYDETLPTRTTFVKEINGIEDPADF